VPAAAAPVAAGRRIGRGLLLALGGAAAVAAGAIIAIFAIGGGGGGSRSSRSNGAGGVAPPPPARTTGTTSTRTTSTTPTTTSPSATTTAPSPPPAAPCSATDDSGKSWTITIVTPKTTNCAEAQQVWVQYQRKVAQDKVGFQNVGDWNCRPGHCYKRAPPDPQYATFDAKPA